MGFCRCPCPVLGSRNSPYSPEYPIPFALSLLPLSDPRHCLPGFPPSLSPNPQLLLLRPGLGTSLSPRTPVLSRVARRRRAPAGGRPPYLQLAEQRAEREPLGQRAAPPGARDHGAEERAGRRRLRPLLPPRRGGLSGPRSRPAPPRPAPRPAPPRAAQPRHLSPLPRATLWLDPAAPGRWCASEGRGGAARAACASWAGGGIGALGGEGSGGDLGCSPPRPPESSAAVGAAVSPGASSPWLFRLHAASGETRLPAT